MAQKKIINAPRRDQIKIDFDQKNKVFSLSTSIFASDLELPASIKTYVEARKGRFFKPHNTSFELKASQVFLHQRICFSEEMPLRQQTDHFFNLAKSCSRMLSEMAIEEKFKDALSIQ